MDEQKKTIWKLKAIFAALFIPGMIMFMYWAPWMASKPIEEIRNHLLSNVPPPIEAKAFAINHGEAIYYNHGTAMEEPLWFGLLTVGIFLLWLVMVFLYFKIRRVNNAINT